MSALLPVIQQGSSPLARGLLFIRALYVRDDGIVPARAGFTPWWMATHRHGADHPRSRGVYRRGPVQSFHRVGSSPLARGLLRAVGHLRRELRIIPARAGFTSEEARMIRVSPGSSPLARGLRLVLRSRRERGGIIPARAGFTRVPAAGCCRPRDHPRSRGVYLSRVASTTSRLGSSPLARGLRPPRVVVGVVHVDHPRSRGVYQSALNDLASATGSSPLARGLQVAAVSLQLRGRIIPARAGFTCSCGCRRRGSSDHPRSRGVYAPAACACCHTSGSSPLARGLRAGR